jgi:microcystin-dependent protein
MAWSGGTFTRVDGATGWQDDEAAGTGIEAGLMDTAFNDLATDGINQSLNKAGQNTPTANLPMGGYKHTGVANASASDEYVAYGQLSTWVPPGVIQMFAGSSAPTGFLLCSGAAVSRTGYAALFSAIGTAFGAGDGSTTFNLPDLRGRVIAGLDNMGGSDAGRLSWSNTMGTTGGAQTHTLSVSEMPSHTHTQDAHSHTLADQVQGLLGYGQGSPISGNAVVGLGAENTGSTTATNQNTGGGGAHNNMQPTILMNYIIKT